AAPGRSVSSSSPIATISPAGGSRGRTNRIRVRNAEGPCMGPFAFATLPAQRLRRRRLRRFVGEFDAFESRRDFEQLLRAQPAEAAAVVGVNQTIRSKHAAWRDDRLR